MRFKKIASVLASAAMLFSTVGFAAAANYPQPFVSASGVPDVAIVYGSHPAMADATAAANIQNHLNSKVVAGAVSGTPTISGNAATLASGSNYIYLNDGLNKNVQTITKDDLSNILADGTFTDDAGNKYKLSLIHI